MRGHRMSRGAIQEDAGRARRADGFSVLEMMIAMSLIAVGLMGMGQLMMVAIEQNDYARYNTVGIQLARGKIEELKAAYDAEVATGQTVTDMSAGTHGPETITPSGTGGEAPRSYAVTWQVQDLGSQRRRVTVQVRPSGMSSPETQTPNRAKTITMTGLFTP